MTEAAGTDDGTQGAPQGAPTDEGAQAPQQSWGDLFPDMDPAAVREALDQSRKWERRAKESHDKAQKFDRLQAEQMTEAQRLTARAEAAERAQAEAATQLTRYQVAAAEGVPAELVDLLTGEDSEAMTTVARRLMSHVRATSSAPAPSYDGGARTSAVPPAGMSDLIREAAGRRG